jgi:hypothetical protein
MTFHQSGKVWMLSILSVLMFSGSLYGLEYPNLAGRREIFVDTHWIQQLRDVNLKLKEPVDQGAVLSFDQPWEGAFSGYGTLIKDASVYRLYYRGLPNAGQDGSAIEVTCYADSPDGLTWNKPNLDLHPLPDYPSNNIILADSTPASHNFTPFLDTHPRAEISYRYKALGGIASSGLMAFGSRDGVRWTQLQEAPVFKPDGWVLDSQNVAFWSETESKYVLYFRSSVDGIRSIAKATSRDFKNWQIEGQMRFSDTETTRPSHHLYTNQTQPYFRAPHIYLATAARFFPGRKVLSDQQADAIGVHPKYFNDTSDSVLMSSRGGLMYDRTFLSALVRPGIGPKNWVSRSNYPVLGIVATGDNEMSLYANQDYGQPSAHLHRYSFRMDGLSCLSAGDREGEWITKPFLWGGGQVFLNFSTSAAGYIKIEMQSQDGKPIEGYSLSEAQELIGNEIEKPYQWMHRKTVTMEGLQTIRLRVLMMDAELYAIRFDD